MANPFFAAPGVTEMVATTLRAQNLCCFVPVLVLRHLAESGRTELTAWRDAFPAAVLFADISGFTKLSERLGKRGPAGVEELTQILNDYFGDLIDAVISSGGDIVKFAGDALLAVWPQDNRNHTSNIHAAAECALRAQGILKERQTRTGEALSLRIGIGTGMLSTATVGGERNRWEFLVAGPPVLEATIAAEAAEKGEVVLSASAASALAHSIQGRPDPDGQWRLEGVEGISSLSPQVVPANPLAFEKQILGFIPAAIHRRLDVGHGNWLGELRRLTVLFINLPNLNHHSPLSVSQQVMRTLQTALYRYEGSVNKISVDDKA
jgi:class 3 adenylate cyclase